MPRKAVRRGAGERGRQESGGRGLQGRGRREDGRAGAVEGEGEMVDVELRDSEVLDVWKRAVSGKMGHRNECRD